MTSSETVTVKVETASGETIMESEVNLDTIAASTNEPELVSMKYSAHGVMNVTIPHGLTDQTVVDQIIEKISTILDVNPEDVTVNVTDDGVKYAISSQDQNDVQEIQARISSNEFASDFATQMQESSNQVY